MGVLTFVSFAICLKDFLPFCITIPTGGIEPHQIVVKKPFVRIISTQKSDDNSTTTSAALPVYIDVADDPQEQNRGLMFRKSLDSNSGMLFVFEDTANRSFWMKNTFIPLDMIFIDNDLRIVGLFLLIASAIMAIYLNNEGVKCLSELSRSGNMSLEKSQQLEQLKGNCFFITNSYVYSLFGLVIDALIIIVWYSKYRNVWQAKFDK